MAASRLHEPQTGYVNYERLHTIADVARSGVFRLTWDSLPFDSNARDSLHSIALPEELMNEDTDGKDAEQVPNSQFDQWESRVERRLRCVMGFPATRKSLRCVSDLLINLNVLLL